MTERAQKRVESLIKRYGSEEAYKKKQKEWSRLGGLASTGGFRGMTKKQRSNAGKAGGSVPRIKEDRS